VLLVEEDAGLRLLTAGAPEAAFRVTRSTTRSDLLLTDAIMSQISGSQLRKPFSAAELVARVEALAVRRTLSCSPSAHHSASDSTFGSVRMRKKA
jgi:hypothetical protein